MNTELDEARCRLVGLQGQIVAAELTLFTLRTAILDGFKQVNDEFGHAVGDLLLQRAAQVLLATVRDSDTVCRMGGDEFVVLAAASRPEDAGQVADKIARALAEPCLLGGHDLRISASIGWSVFPDDGESSGVLMRRADEAMYRRKRAVARRR